MERKKWITFWLGAIILLFGFNGNLLITDSVESNYALTAKEMVISGDWMSPQIYGKYWFDKPIMFYWTTALGFVMFGFNEFAARFFPALFGLATIGIITWGTKKIYDEKTAFYSGIILLTTVEFFLISKSIITDSLLMFFFSATLLFFYLGFSTENKNYYYVMYASAGFATLTKGPIGFLLPGLIMVIFLLVTKGWNEIKNMKLLSGIILFLLVGLPWYYHMYQIHGQAFLDGFLGTHNLYRATASEHPKDNVIYYYFAVNLLALFPWTTAVFGYFYDLFKQGKAAVNFDQRSMFLLIWAGCVFGFFQLMATKYITYTYPLLFPMSIVLGHYLSTRESLLFKKKYFTVYIVINLLLIGAIGWVSKSGKAAINDYDFIPVAIAIVAMTIIVACGKYNKENSIRTIAICVLIFNLSLVGTVAIPLSNNRSGKQLADNILSIAKDRNQVGLFSGRYPTSAVFYSGKTILKLLNEKEIENYQPRAYSWKAKNVMPYAEIKSYMSDKNNVVIIEKRDLKYYETAINIPYTVVKDTPKYLFVVAK